MGGGVGIQEIPTPTRRVLSTASILCSAHLILEVFLCGDGFQYTCAHEDSEHGAGMHQSGFKEGSKILPISSTFFVVSVLPDLFPKCYLLYLISDLQKSNQHPGCSRHVLLLKCVMSMPHIDAGKLHHFPFY